MPKTAFISRALTEESLLACLLTEAGWAITGISLLELTPLPVAGWPTADWIFFSSQNAVHFFFGPGMPPAPAGARWAALGPATAAALQQYVASIQFSGTGDPFETAQTFAALAAGQRVLFPGARHSQESLRQQLAPALTVLPIAIYDNRPVSAPPRRDETVLIFTSPMNARAYFKHWPLQAHQQLVAIGRTTAAALQALGFEQVVTATAPTEGGLAATVLALSAV